MFSSLPSASKIYQSSVKPRQKSSTSAKKRRKKAHSLPIQHASVLDESVMSLVACDEDGDKIDRYDRENSSPDVSLYSVGTSDINARSTDSFLGADNHTNFACEIKEINTKKLVKNLRNNQNMVLLKHSNENDQPDMFESSTEENSKIKNLCLMDEKLHREFEAVLAPETCNQSNLQDLPCNKDCIKEIEFDLKHQKDQSEMSFEEVEASIEEESLKELLNKQLKLNDTEVENVTPPGNFESNVNLESSLNKCSIKPNEPEYSNGNNSSHNIACEENIPLESSQIKNDTMSSQSATSHIESSSDCNDITCTSSKQTTDSAIECSNNSNDVTSMAHTETTDSAIVKDPESDLNNMSAHPDINGSCISDINNSKENVDYWINADSNDQDIKASEVKGNNEHSQSNLEFSVRTQSPEQSELSCTESVQCEAKDYRQDMLSPEIHSDSIEKSNEFISSYRKPKEFSTNSSNISQSFSNLLFEDSQTTVSSRSTSLPEGLYLSKKFVDKHSQSTVLTVSDKATITANLDCIDSSEESLSEQNFSSVEDQNETNKHSETKNSLPGCENKNSLWNVLPPLAMVKARSRSYVFGSKGPTGSLLGSDELCRFFPENKVTIFVGTWNMNGHDPPQSIDDFLLPLAIDTLPDIYAIGVQESMQSRLEWEVLLQTTLGPSHVLFTSTSLGVLHLCIFLRRDLIWFCSEPEEASVATRPGTMVKTKGAVAVCFMCFGTSFLFVNSHLTAHEQKLKERLSDYEKIISSLELPKSIPSKNHSRDKDVTSRFDCVFWCGDLNFRVMHDRPSVLSFVEEKVRNARPSCSFLVKRDQLHKAMEEGRAFHGFKESVIHFIPSYKFDVGTSTFNSSKLRVPSYTDRILYRSKDKSLVSCLHYNAVPDISTSDHKPVYAVFKVTLKPGRDNVPLAAGMFKRDVYLEAIKRRSKFLEVRHNQGQSAICSLM